MISENPARAEIPAGSECFSNRWEKNKLTCTPARQRAPSACAPTRAARALELRTRDRQRKLVAKIDSALRRIDDGEYGYCEETGEPISLRRLDARPIATLSLEAQERHERREKVHRDD